MGFLNVEGIFQRDVVSIVGYLARVPAANTQKEQTMGL